MEDEMELDPMSLAKMSWDWMALIARHHSFGKFFTFFFFFLIIIINNLMNIINSFFK